MLESPETAGTSTDQIQSDSKSALMKKMGSSVEKLTTSKASLKDITKSRKILIII